MNTATKDTLELAGKLDKLKSDIHKINKRKAIEVMNSDDPDMFTLYYSFFSLFNEKEEVELETIDLVCTNERNADRIKAVYSALHSGAAWTSSVTFMTSIQAILGENIDPESSVPYDAEDLTWAIIVLMGIDGAELFPAKTQVVRYIAASLSYYNHIEVPVTLRFNSIVGYFKYDVEPKGKIETLGIQKLASLSSLDGFNDIKGSELNDLLESTEVATSIMSRYNKLMSEWISVSG